MCRSVFLFTWLLLALPLQAAPGDRPRLADVLALEEAMQDAIKKAEPSIASVLVARGETDLSNPDTVPESYGSGVVIDEKGLILTNRHVVSGAARVFVRLPGGKATYAELHADDPRSDLAVIRLTDAKVLPVPAIKLGDGGAVKKGQFVLSLANPFAAGFRDGSPSASWGILGNVRRRVPGATREQDLDKTLQHYGILLQTDARLNLGCSGGALIDLRGELIGLTTSTAAIAGGETPGGFALPMDAGLRRIVEKLRQGEEVEYGFLGVVFDRPAKGGGVRIKNVLPGSPAHRAELRDLDVVLKVNGVELADMDDLFLAIGTHLAGSRILLDVRTPAGSVRQGVEVTLAKFQIPEKLGKPFFTRRPPAPGGLRVDYTSILAQRPSAGLWGGVPPGVAIREVQARSAAEAARLQVDKVITHVDGERVNDPAHFYKLMEAAKARGTVELTLHTSDARPDKVKIDLR